MLTPTHAVAAILVESGKPLVVDEIQLPSELRFGQVLVEVHYSGICGAQINEIQAAKGPDKFLPHLLGHEGYATVLEVGEGVTTVKAGERVVMHWRPGSGLQGPTAKYRWGDRTVNSGWVTTFNTHAVVSENRITVVDPTFDPKVAPLLGCALTTAFGVVNNDAGVRVGESVVVIGTGGVGLALIQAARMVSAYPILGIDLHSKKLDAALRLGASHVIDSSTEEEVEKTARAMLGEDEADVVIETTGVASLIEMAYRLTSSSGRTVCVGVPAAGQEVRIYTLPLHFDKILTGSHGGDCHPAYDIPRLVRLAQSERVSFDSLPTTLSSLYDVNHAIARMSAGEIGRQLLDMSELA